MGNRSRFRPGRRRRPAAAEGPVASAQTSPPSSRSSTWTTNARRPTSLPFAWMAPRGRYAAWPTSTAASSSPPSRVCRCGAPAERPVRSGSEGARHRGGRRGAFPGQGGRSADAERVGLGRAPNLSDVAACRGPERRLDPLARGSAARLPREATCRSVISADHGRFCHETTSSGPHWSDCYWSGSASISTQSATHSLQMKTWFGHSPGPPIRRSAVAFDL